MALIMVCDYSPAGLVRVYGCTREIAWVMICCDCEAMAVTSFEKIAIRLRKND